MADLTLRPMTADDWPDVERIYAEGIATGHATFEAAPPERDAFLSTRVEGLSWVAESDVLRSADAAGIWTVQSSIFPENAGSLALHERCGFRIVGRREGIAKMTYGPEAGRWRDTFLLERRSAIAGVD